MASSSPDRTVRVFIVDDHEVVSRALAELVQAEPDLELVGTAATAAEAVDRLLVAGADVVLLDISLPDGNGIDVCREVRSRRSELRCLMLTSHDDQEAGLAALLAGAAGHLSKEASALDIVGGIRRVAQGQTLFDPSALTRSTSGATQTRATDEPALGVLPTALLQTLTKGQREILALVLRGSTNQEIALRLGLAETGVVQQLRLIFATLGLERRIQARYREANRIN